MEERNLSRLEPTLGDLAAEYLERHRSPTNGRPACATTAQMIDSVINPKFGKFRLKAIGRLDIEVFDNSMKSTPYLANRVLALLSKDV